MNEEYNNLESNPPEESNQTEQLSNTDAMAGIFTSPSETFETIADTQKKNYWLLPMIISILIGLVTTFLFMSDAELVSKTMEKQKQKMMEKFEENVKEGKMTQEDVDKAMESMDPKGMFFKILGFGGAVIGPFIILLLLSVVYLLALKILKANFDFTNILNVVGLAMLIAAVGNLLSMVISILKGNFSTLGPSLFFNEDSIGEKTYTFLTKLDLFSVWFYAVIAVGLSRISRTDILKTTGIAFGVWIAYIMASTFLF